MNSESNITDGPIRCTISEAQAGMPLAEFLHTMLGSHEAANVLFHGGVWIGRERVQDGTRLLATDESIIISQPPGNVYVDLQINPAWIVYEDADLLALNKPPNTYVEATPWDALGHLRVALERFLAARDAMPPTVHLAHRLDRDTSGVLLFSKNPAVNPRLQKAFAGGGIQKHYLCRCAGDPTEDVFELVTGHGRGAKGKFRVFPVEEIGLPFDAGRVVKHMHTRFRVLERDGDSTMVQAEPITGRTHQIRLHLAAAGYPLLGDQKYGGPQSWRGEALPYHLLHATRLALRHPHTNEPLVIEAPVPWWVGQGQIITAT